MNVENKETMKTLNGKEFAFKDLGIVGVEKDNLIQYGKIILKVNDKNIKKVIDAHNYSEYGTTDFNAIMEMEEF